MPLPQTPTVQYGDLVMLTGKGRHTYLRTVRAGERFECHLGFIEFDTIVGSSYGIQVHTNTGHKLFLLRPNIDDIIRQSPNGERPS